MIFTSTKGGSVVTENPKEGRGSLKTLAGFREGATQICMKKGRHGGGGGGVSPKSSAPPPPLQAINNDWFLTD